MTEQDEREQIEHARTVVQALLGEATGSKPDLSEISKQPAAEAARYLLQLLDIREEWIEFTSAEHVQFLTDMNKRT